MVVSQFIWVFFQNVFIWNIQMQIYTPHFKMVYFVLLLSIMHFFCWSNWMSYPEKHNLSTVLPKHTKNEFNLDILMK